jgi:hypothetical protein
MLPLPPGLTFPRGAADCNSLPGHVRVADAKEREKTKVHHEDTKTRRRKEKECAAGAARRKKEDRRSSFARDFARNATSLRSSCLGVFVVNLLSFAPAKGKGADLAIRPLERSDVRGS